MAVETENVEVQEVEEFIDGKIRKIRRTIRTKIEDEVITVEEIPPQPTPEAEHEAEHEAEPQPAPEPTPEPAPEVSVLLNRLICQCVTPSGNPTYGLVCDNHDGTFTLDVNASESGVHKVIIQMDGKAIPGSPFLVRIVQAVDKRKVRMYGAGLESGIIDNYQGLFHIDTKGAGPGDLKVRVHGPKGGFDVQMSRDNPLDRIINVQYNPTTPGIYTVGILWSGEHIDGSPHELFISPNAAILHTWHEDPITCRANLKIELLPSEW